MKLYIDVFIQKETALDRQYLVNRTRDTKLGVDVSVVYIYSLADESVNYPEKPGHVIYIGEAGRSSESTGTRFSQHISTGPSKGGTLGTIYSLSRYYWLGKRLRLQVFLVENSQLRKTLEREIINAHVKEFGSLPMCQGTTGQNYRTTCLSSLVVSQELLSLF
jgi:hypothetical protein